MDLPEESTPEKIGERLRWFRKKHLGVDQKLFAAEIGVTVTRYSNWETGSIFLPPPAALQLVAKYGLTLDFLYRGELDRLPNHLLNAWLSRAAASSAKSSSDN